MTPTDLTAALLAGLVELEQSGDLVITHSAPHVLADRLCAKVIQRWGSEFLDTPIEAVIDTGMKSSAESLAEIFSIGRDEAVSAVEKFVRSLGERRTPTEVAELIAHQGVQEIALGAYFCNHLGRGEYYSADYLDWRKDQYAKRRGK